MKPFQGHSWKILQLIKDADHLQFKVYNTQTAKCEASFKPATSIDQMKWIGGLAVLSSNEKYEIWNLNEEKLLLDLSEETFPGIFEVISNNEIHFHGFEASQQSMHVSFSTFCPNEEDFSNCWEVEISMEASEKPKWPTDILINRHIQSNSDSQNAFEPLETSVPGKTLVSSNGSRNLIFKRQITFKKKSFQDLSQFDSPLNQLVQHNNRIRGYLQLHNYTKCQGSSSEDPRYFHHPALHLKDTKNPERLRTIHFSRMTSEQELERFAMDDRVTEDEEEYYACLSSEVLVMLVSHLVKGVTKIMVYQFHDTDTAKSGRLVNGEPRKKRQKT